jgi:hypothetical protein
MLFQVCAIRDRAVDAFNPPLCVAHQGQAVRGFTDEINRKAADNQLNAHPEDFDLYHLGTFNSETGIFDVGQPRMICVGKDVYVP